MITPEQIVDAIEESMFDCYPQWRELTPSDLPIVAERIANALAHTEPEDEPCPDCEKDWLLTPYPYHARICVCDNCLEYKNQITLRKIEESMVDLGYDCPAQMPVKEVLDWLQQEDK